ncbi:MAG: hypothetical protein QW795_08420 [Candidatus Bathyarchaeia archaeon]
MSDKPCPDTWTSSGNKSDFSIAIQSGHIIAEESSSIGNSLVYVGFASGREEDSSPVSNRVAVCVADSCSDGNLRAAIGRNHKWISHNSDLGWWTGQDVKGKAARSSTRLSVNGDLPCWAWWSNICGSGNASSVRYCGRLNCPSRSIELDNDAADRIVVFINDGCSDFGSRVNGQTCILRTRRQRNDKVRSGSTKRHNTWRTRTESQGKGCTNCPHLRPQEIRTCRSGSSN